MYWTPLYPSKHKLRKSGMRPPTSELPPYMEAKDCKADGVLEVNKLEHGICRI